MDWNSVQQFIRIVMQFFGGVLVSYGWLDEAGLQALTGAVISVGAFVWWWVWNRKRPAATE